MSTQFGEQLRVKKGQIASFLFGLALVLLTVSGFAQVSGQISLAPRSAASAFIGLPIEDVELSLRGELWQKPIRINAIQSGDVYSPDLVRRALNELGQSGLFADFSAGVRKGSSGVVLVLQATPRRMIQAIVFEGASISETGRRALGLERATGVTYFQLQQAEADLKRYFAKRGYPHAEVQVRPEETDEANAVLLRTFVVKGQPELIQGLQTNWIPTQPIEELLELGSSLGFKAGDRFDAQAIDKAAEELQLKLIERGFYEALVSWQHQEGAMLETTLRTGPLYNVRIEGLEFYDHEVLIEALKLEEQTTPQAEVLRPLAERFLQDRGFYDAQVKVEIFNDQGGHRAEIFVAVRQGERVRVTKRAFPCLKGVRSEQEMNQEIDGVLAEEFPTTSLLTPPDPSLVDEAMGGSSASRRAVPIENYPWANYSPRAYEVVKEHIEELFRAEGYLDARVDTPQLLRSSCEKAQNGRSCSSTTQVSTAAYQCDAEAKVSLDSCEADLKRGVFCAAEATLVLPIIPGRQTLLYDISIKGAQNFSLKELKDIGDFVEGRPFRPSEIDAGIRQIRELYLDRGYAFAQVDSDIELSPDQTRARLLIEINPRKKVTIERIDIIGARRTRENVIRRRLAIKEKGLYLRRDVQKTQKQIESLGVFTSVSVGFQDPGIAASHKVVIIRVSERSPQYVDIGGGFATGDGFRISFEYGNRSLGGSTVALTIRSQLGLRPPGLIPQQDVRQKYEELLREEGLLDLLERRNTITFGFPDIGLGPEYRLEIEALDLRDNQRDFGQTKEAGILRLGYNPLAKVFFQGASSTEYNDASIFGSDGKQSLEDWVSDNPGASTQVRVPEGRTVAFSQSLVGVWDRRDLALAATRGTYLSLGLEHVTAIPVDERAGKCNLDTDDVFAAACSELLRYTGRVAGYIPLNKKGLTLALSFRAGIIQHLTSDSLTYPDRLFFMGGVDTLRGYLQDSLVPQDLADRILDPNSGLTIEDIVLRGGDVFLSPRAELRIPLVGSLETALFLDTGNVWKDPTQINPFQLRYTLGSGLRFATPVGPLVFDYGLNLERLMDRIIATRANQRTWESLGAFHFSIGLF